MVDPFSLTVGAVGLTTAALQSMRSLYDFIKDIRDAPDAISRIRSELTVVQAVLEALKAAADDDTGGLLAALKSIIADARVESAVDDCTQACKDFNVTLQKWMKHSTETKTSWRDSVRIGFLEDTKINAFIRRLGACKSTVTLALSSAAFLNTCNEAHLSENMRKMQLASKEKELLDTRTAAEVQMREVYGEEQQLAITSAATLSHTAVDEANPVLGLQVDLRQVRKSLQEYVELCKAVESKLQEARTGQSIENIKATTKGRAIVGIINFEGEESRIDQNIKDVSAESESRVIAGVARNVKLDDFGEDQVN